MFIWLTWPLEKKKKKYQNIERKWNCKKKKKSHIIPLLADIKSYIWRWPPLEELFAVVRFIYR